MFHLQYELAGLRPAQYNPRRVSADTLEALQASLLSLGACKNIVVAKDGLIIAGHQRVRAALSLRWTHLPAFVLADVPEADQTRFNQLHNGVDADAGVGPVTLPPRGPGWCEVAPTDIIAEKRAVGAPIREHIATLWGRYGAFGNVVCTPSGEVVCNRQFALTAALIRRPIRACYLTAEQAQHVSYLTREYGVFSYAHLPLTTWAQTYAQKPRLRGTGTSTLYEGHVIPYLDKHPGVRVLDFGCGQGDYLKLLRARGVDIHGVEFYARTGSAIDLGRVEKYVRETLGDLRANGRWDVVVCDSVLNSTDRDSAEKAVINTCRALCRRNGMLFISGLSRESVHASLRSTQEAKAKHNPFLRFLDEGGYSALLNRGVWMFQRYHSPEQIAQIAQGLGTDARVYDASGSWKVVAHNTEDLADEDAEAALRYEFALPLPGGRHHPYADDAIEAWRSAPQR